ncbi:hypothetical protein ACFCYC_05070 [Streptomyces sp. NPDC056402]|uniref:hypothetical protein n=1 Tax=Streptomyces sp. NPDC056402 TaxID=3345810 RepID=UPI0035D884F6
MRTPSSRKERPPLLPTTLRPSPPGGLPESAGDGTGSQVLASADQLSNDARVARYIGAAPPAGHDPHRSFITVQALDILATGVRLTAPPDSPERPPPCTSTTFPTPPSSATARWT